MTRINLDARTAGLPVSGTRVFESEEVEVTSGELIEGNLPVLIVSFKVINTIVAGGGTEKDAWNVLRTGPEKVNFCWKLLLDNLSRGFFLDILQHARSESLSAGVDAFKSVVGNIVDEFVVKIKTEIQ